MKLYAVRIFVRTWDGACGFYKKKLQLPERFRNDDTGWAEYDLGGPCIGLQRVDASDSEEDRLVGRFVGVSLQVDDIAASYRELSGCGVVFRSAPERQPWGGWLAHLADPDGNILTLLGS